MTIIHEESVEERNVDRTLDSYSQELTYVVRGDPGDITDENDVVTYLLENLAQVLYELPFNSITGVNRVNDDFYKATVLYETPEGLDDDEEEVEQGATYTIDTTGGSTHIDSGIELIGKAGNAASDLIGAGINWDGERMNGVDITTPAFKWTKTVRIPKSQYTDEFAQKLYQATGKVNDAPFLFFLAGDAKFDGAQTTHIETFDDIEDEVEITYHVSAIETVLVPSEPIDGQLLPAKRGWDYVWFQFAKTVDVNAKSLVPKKIAGYVDKVLEETSFADLGINE